MTIIWGPSGYPTTLDTFFTTFTLTDNVDEVIANHPNTLGVAIVALQNKLGIDGNPVTGLGGASFTAKTSNPGSVGVPTIWVDSSGGPNYDIKFTDELGTTTSLLGGGASTLQDAYVGGNTIAATSAEGVISFSVADTQNISVLSLTQNDVTNDPSALYINSSATFSTTTGSGAAIYLDGSNASIFSNSPSRMLVGSFNGMSFTTANGSLELLATESLSSGTVAVSLTSYPQIPATSNATVTVNADCGVGRGASSTASLLSTSGTGGAFNATVDIYSTAQGDNNLSDSSINIVSYANGIAGGLAGTSTILLNAHKNVGTGDVASTLTLTSESITGLTRTVDISGTYTTGDGVADFYSVGGITARTTINSDGTLDTGANAITKIFSEGAVYAITRINCNALTGTATIEIGVDDKGEGADVVRIGDANAATATSWTDDYITLSDSSTDWDTMATNFGANATLVDILNTLSSSGGGTLDNAYDFGGSGAGRSIVADSGAVAIAVGVGDNNQTLELTQGDTTNDPHCLYIDNRSVSALVNEAASIFLHTSGKITSDVDMLLTAYSTTTGVTNTLGATVSGTALDATVEVVASSIAGTTGQAYTHVYTTSFSGDSYVSVEAQTNSGSSWVEIGSSATGDVRLDDANQTGSSWTQSYISLSDNTTEWDNLETNCGGEVSLIQAINLAFSSGGGVTTTWSGTTSNATPTEIFIDGISSNRHILTANQTDAFFLRVVARDDTNNKSKVWKIEAAAQRDGSNNSSLVGSASVDVVTQSDTLGGGSGTDLWSISVSVNDSDESFRITVTGQALTTIGWVVAG